MRLDNLLAVRPAAFVATTDSIHDLEVHLNLAKRMQLNGINSAMGGGYYIHPFANLYQGSLPEA
jgi:hypothetical protein